MVSFRGKSGFHSCIRQKRDKKKFNHRLFNFYLIVLSLSRSQIQSFFSPARSERWEQMRRLMFSTFGWENQRQLKNSERLLREEGRKQESSLPGLLTATCMRRPCAFHNRTQSGALKRIWEEGVQNSEIISNNERTRSCEAARTLWGKLWPNWDSLKAGMKSLLEDHHLKPPSLERSGAPLPKNADKKRSCSRNWSCRTSTEERLVADNHIMVMMPYNTLVKSLLNKERRCRWAEIKALKCLGGF